MTPTIQSRPVLDSTHSPFNPPIPKNTEKPFIWTQLNGCGDSLAIANAVTNTKGFFLVITSDNQTSLRLEHELKFFLADATSILHFPDWETLPYDVFSPLPDIVSQRLKTLFRLPQIRCGILIITVPTLMQRIAPREHIIANSFSVKIGEELNLEEKRQQLEHVGYQCVSQVVQHGEFAIRGSIIDIFPMGSSLPYRIELFDEEVETIRTFDTETQRSLEKAENINLFPAREFPFTDESIKHFRQEFRAAFPTASQRNPLYQDISKGIALPGIEYYQPLFVEKTETLFDYLPPEATLIQTDSTLIAGQEFFQEVKNRFEQRRHNLDRPILAPETIYLLPETLCDRIDKFPQIHIFETEQRIEPSHDHIAKFSTQPLPNLSLQPSHKQASTALESFLAQFHGKTLFVAETIGHREALLETLHKHNIRPDMVDSWQDFQSNGSSLCLLVASIDHGLWIPDPEIAIITESQLAGERAQQRRRRRKSSVQDLENVIGSLTELSIGSPVVHKNHGVGRYQGLKKISVGSIDTEFLSIEYANNDKLYVPVSSLQLIGRYSGANPDTAPLHNLSGDQWSKARRKALKRVRDVAAELLDINAKRASKKGYRYQIDDAEYESFALAFPFEETPDQEAAIDNVVQDMISDQAMDRVICGDVGFGKTEVSMRAAFIAVHNDKQVAVLVPTTLLAQQHFHSFRDRFANWPIRIEVLSRFVTKKDQISVIEDLRNGKVDIIIGTHKLVQKDVAYKELGLIVIDEEHRFGVRHKEHFKTLRSELDILTLTATPIPRTLNMAMSGLRDISIIATPPINRHAIQTFVTEWVDATVQEACLREIKRGGQVYFLHNNVKTITRMEEEIRSLVPEARVEIAHGQMAERKLEGIMLDFYHQRFNVLLCTTIIESGIDIPSANTIIINRADKLGLSQLHQLRGRVGRSHHRAYAYLLVPPKKLMTRDAVKRLQAIETSADLGAGFMLSSHDLEIRGAGELLGDEQSGQIQEIGITLYIELLEQAVSAIKSGRHPELDAPLDAGPEVDLQVTSLIPDEFIPDIHLRLVLYKRIANAQHTSELRDLQIEIIDRFGLLPDATKFLFTNAEIKLKVTHLGIKTLKVNSFGGHIVINQENQIDPGQIIKLIQNQPDSFKLDGPDKLRFIQDFDSDRSKVTFVNELFQTIATSVPA